MKRRESPFDVLLLLALLIAGGSLGRLQSMARDRGTLDPIGRVVSVVLDPVAIPAGSAVRGMSDFWNGIFRARELTTENRRLAALARAAELYTMQLERLNSEIEDLRTMQGFAGVPGKNRVPARVIGYAPYENRLTLDVGSTQGVGLGMPVQAPAGLVGTVQTVERDRCQVLLVTSRGLTVGALDLDRDPPPAGLLRGENSSTLAVTFEDPKAPVEIGDRIVTSGFSELIPRGIYIGRVIAVSPDEEFGMLRVRVDPAVSVGDLGEVQVLK